MKYLLFLLVPVSGFAQTVTIDRAEYVRLKQIEATIPPLLQAYDSIEASLHREIELRKAEADTLRVAVSHYEKSYESLEADCRRKRKKGILFGVGGAILAFFLGGL